VELDDARRALTLGARTGLPVVPVGFITEGLARTPSLELAINGEYKRRVEELRVLAGSTTHDARNPVFRVLQILDFGFRRTILGRRAN
jgi:hypothetical protein